MIVFFGWNGKGIWAVLVPLIFLVGYILAIIHLDWKVGHSHLWVTGAIFALSGIFVFWLGRKFNAPIDVISQRLLDETGSVPVELRQRHSVYGVRMEWWGVGEFLFGAFLIGERISSLM